MTMFRNLFAATSCLLLSSSSSAFVLPQSSLSPSTTTCTSLAMSASAAPPRRGPGPPPREDQYRPRSKFDQNDPFINTPYGQAHEFNSPVGPQQQVRYERANVDQWKRETSRQDAFINGAYGSGGVGRYGLDLEMGGPSSAGPTRRSYNSNQYIDPKARQQDDFINNPYGNKIAPGRPGFEEERGIHYERYRKERPPMGQGGPVYERYNKREDPRRAPRQSMLEEKFERFRKEPPPGMMNNDNGPPHRPEPRPRRRQDEEFLDNYNGSNRMQQPPRGQGGKRLERYDPRDARIFQDRSQDEFLENHAGSNRMQYQEPPRAPRYERFDPRQDTRQRYAEENELIERSPGKRMQNNFDPRRYETPSRRGGDRMMREENFDDRRQGDFGSRQDFIDNPNGSSFRPGQYGYGNDGEDRAPRYPSYKGGW